jgi:hypothetical protein
MRGKGKGRQCSFVLTYVDCDNEFLLKFRCSAGGNWNKGNELSVAMLKVHKMSLKLSC